jgi:hypothetical protein
MRRSFIAFLLLAVPISAEPLYWGPEYMASAFFAPAPYFEPMPDVVRSVPATSSSSGGGGTSLPVADTQTIVKGSSDGTKLIRFEVDGLTAGQTRVITAPDSNTTLPIFSQIITFSGPTAARTVTLPDSAFTVAGLGVAQTFSAANLATARWTFGTAADAVDTVDLGETAGHLTWEGAAADSAEHRLGATVNAGFDTTTTIPATGATQTVAVLENAQTFTGTKTFSGALVATNQIQLQTAEQFVLIGGTTIGRISYDTTQTPDTVLITAGTTSNAWNLAEDADEDFDFNNGPCLTAACTTPHLIIHDSDQNVTDYSAHSVGGIAGKMVKTLTDGAATDVVDVTVAADAGTAGMFLTSVYATDGSTPQVRMVRVMFAATNDGGVTTCTLGTPEEIDHTPTGTLTATITCVDGTAAATIQVNAASSLTETTLEARSQVILFGPGQLLPQ